MKKGLLTKICYILCIVLIIAFIIKTVINYIQYNPLSNSAPFYTWIIINFLYFLLPALILFIVGFIVKKKK